MHADAHLLVVHFSTDTLGVQKRDWDLLGLELQATVSHLV